jgi:hypothetical protein
MLSLEGALRTCKVDTAWANRIQSDRFENPELMVCPVWNGFDNSGRPVSADSFVTKSAGCNTPEDRVFVENALRPQYFQYVNLDAEGLNGNLDAVYPTENNMFNSDSGLRTFGLQQLNPKITGQFSQPSGATNYPRCSSYSYDVAQRQIANENRQAQSLQMAGLNRQNKKASGF